MTAHIFWIIALIVQFTLPIESYLHFQTTQKRSLEGELSRHQSINRHLMSSYYVQGSCCASLLTLGHVASSLPPECSPWAACPPGTPRSSLVICLLHPASL